MLAGQLRSAKCLVFSALLILLSENTLAAKGAGVVTKIIGEVTRTSADGMDEEILIKGGSVFSGDSIKTGKKSFVRMLFKDETVVNLSKDAKFLIRKFDFDPEKNTRVTVFGLVKGQMRSLVQRKVKEGQSVKFLGRSISFGVRGTTILANAYKAAKLPVNDLAITSGKVSAKVGGKAFEVGSGQFLNTATVATAGVQTMSSSALAALQKAGSFLPSLVSPTGVPIPLDQALKAAAGIGAAAGALAGGLLAAGALVGGGDDDDKSDKGHKEVKEKKKPIEVKRKVVKKKKSTGGVLSYLPGHNGIDLDLTKEPDDIREVVQKYVELKSKNICYLWFYKSLPGGGKNERFRRKRSCKKYEYND